MPRTRSILNAMLEVGFWLVILSVLLGPLGVGPTAAAAALKTCGVSCPCEEAQEAEPESPGSHDGCNDADADGYHESAPGSDDCPDSCPDCSCCQGLTAGVVPNVVPVVSGSRSSSQSSSPPDAPATGARFGIFRPPRSLT